MNKKQLTNKIVGLVSKVCSDDMTVYKTDFAQQCPYTFVNLIVTFHKQLYTAYGFSKVS